MAGTTNANMGALAVEDVDLATLTESLRSRFARARPVGFLEGRTALRDATAEALDCSDLEAEDIVDTLIAQGFVRYEGDPQVEVDDARPWSLSG
jgi:hypothetical protein